MKDLLTKFAAIPLSVIALSFSGYALTNQGEQGLRGETGTQGEQGIQGETGTQGEQGIQGEAGTQGEQGLQGETGAQGEQGLQGETGQDGENGIGISNIEMYGGVMVVTMTDATKYSFALNDDQIDTMTINMLLSADDQGGSSFLTTDDEAATSSFRWRLSDNAAANISSAIYMAAVTGNENLQSVAKIAIRDLENKISTDQTNIKAWDVAALLEAYVQTGDSNYLTLAESAWETYVQTYSIPRSGSIDYFGFDMYGAFKTSVLMRQYTIDEQIALEAGDVFIEQLNHYITNKDLAITDGVLATDNYAYYGLIEKEFNLGIDTLENCFEMYYATVDFDMSEEVSSQALSYATRAFSELENFDRIAHQIYFNHKLTNEQIEYSQVLVEVLSAYYHVS